MKTVILAGGRGTRLSEETDRKPKPMVHIGDRPMISHIMNIYSYHGVDEFIVCLGYKGYLIKEYFANLALHSADVTIDLAGGTVEHHKASQLSWKVTLVDTGMETMTGGRVRRIRPFLDPREPFCLTYGDGVGNIDIAASIEFHRNHGLLATMTAVHPPARFGTVSVEGIRVTAFDEKLHDSNLLMNGGFFVLEPDVLDYIDDDATVWEREPLERLAKEGQLAAFEHRGFWQPMDTIWEKELLERLWTSGEAPWAV